LLKGRDRYEPGTDVAQKRKNNRERYAGAERWGLLEQYAVFL